MAFLLLISSISNSFWPRNGWFSERPVVCAIIDTWEGSPYGPPRLAGDGCFIVPLIGASVEHMDARKQGDREQPADDEAALTARFRRLGEQRVQPKAGSQQSQSEPSAADPSAIARGFRLSSELVAGVLVGAAIGWALDHWLGISPWGMIVFVLLGFAAGVLNVMRSAGVIAARNVNRPNSGE
jgi:ATP synthase protein I